MYGCWVGGTLKLNSPLALVLVVAASSMPLPILFSVTSSPTEGLFVVLFLTTPLRGSAEAASEQASVNARIKVDFKGVGSFRLRRIPRFRFRQVFGPLQPPCRRAWRHSPPA